MNENYINAHINNIVQKREFSNITLDIIDNMCYNIVKLKTK